MPYAQNHYPFNAEKRGYVENNLPADFIAEGLDQTRGWFYTLHVLAAALFERPAFKNVIVNGLVLAEDGKKMSKRLKNYPDPTYVMHEYGADALRAYLINSAAVRAEPMRFAEKGVRDTVRTVVLPLWNAYKFLSTYAVADGWSPTAADLQLRPSGTADRWILSRVQSFLTDLVAEYDDYALSNVVPAFHRICDDLNNWYIRRGRRRYWRSKEAGQAAERDKAEAYGTLFRVLHTISTAIAPVMPFFSEWMYQRLVVETGLAKEGEESVHLSRFPLPDASLRDDTLEAEVAAVRQAVNLGLAIREREKIGVRRPLGRLTVATPDESVRSAIQTHQEDLLAELNMKSIEVVADDGGLVTLKAKANFKVLGKKLGKRMKQVAGAVAALSAEQVRAFVRDGFIQLEGQLEGETLSGDDILIDREVAGGQAAEAAEGITVLVDTTITDALRKEGLAREVISRVQNLRKAADLDVSQTVELVLACDGALAEVAQDEEMVQLIKGETLAAVFSHQGHAASEELGAEHHAADEIDGERLSVGMRVVSSNPHASAE